MCSVLRGEQRLHWTLREVSSWSGAHLEQFPILSKQGYKHDGLVSFLNLEFKLTGLSLVSLVVAHDVNAAVANAHKNGVSRIDGHQKMMARLRHIRYKYPKLLKQINEFDVMIPATRTAGNVSS